MSTKKVSSVSRETCKHHYVVCNWGFNSREQWANEFICQYCLRVKKRIEVIELNKVDDKDPEADAP